MTHLEDRLREHLRRKTMSSLFMPVYHHTIHWTFSHEKRPGDVELRLAIEADFSMYDALTLFGDPLTGSSTINPEAEFWQFKNSRTGGHILVAVYPKEHIPIVFASRYADWIDF